MNIANLVSIQIAVLHNRTNLETGSPTVQLNQKFKRESGSAVLLRGRD